MAVQRDTTFIYGLIDPRTAELRWIGKSDDPERRLRGHMHCITGGAPRLVWFAELRQLGLRPLLLVLEECAADAWQEAERHWIDAMRAAGHPLLNVKAGGGGSDSHTFTNDHRRAISEAHKRSPAVRVAQEKAAAAVRGIQKSPEHRAKIGARSRGQSLGLDARGKISAARKGKPTRFGPMTDVQRANIVAGRKRAYEARNGERDALIAELRADGLSLPVIGRRVGLAPQTVLAVLRRAAS